MNTQQLIRWATLGLMVAKIIAPRTKTTLDDRAVQILEPLLQDPAQIQRLLDLLNPPVATPPAYAALAGDEAAAWNQVAEAERHIALIVELGRLLDPGAPAVADKPAAAD